MSHQGDDDNHPPPGFHYPGGGLNQQLPQGAPPPMADNQNLPGNPLGLSPEQWMAVQAYIAMNQPTPPPPHPVPNPNLNPRLVNPIYLPAEQVLQPLKRCTPSCIILPETQQGGFQFKAGMIRSLPEFNGIESESAYNFLNDFVAICSTFGDSAVDPDTVCLRMFPFALKNRAKAWFNSLAPYSIETWEEMQKVFLNKYFPHHQTLKYQERISQFTTSPSEKFFQAWERFKDLILACPHHGYEKWWLIKKFHTSLSAQLKQTISSMCGGNLFKKSTAEIWQFFDDLADELRTWENSPLGVAQPTSGRDSATKGGIYQLNEAEEWKAKYVALKNKMEVLEIEKVNAIAASPEVTICGFCHNEGHRTDDCYQMAMAKDACVSPVQTAHYAQQQLSPNHHQSKGNPFTQTYNPGWRNHPNFSWRNENPQQNTTFRPQYRPPGQGAYVAPPHRQHEPSSSSSDSRVDALEKTVSEMSRNLNELIKVLGKPAGKLPAQPEPYPPKKVPCVEGNSSGPNVPNQVYAVTVLRNGNENSKMGEDPRNSSSWIDPTGAKQIFNIPSSDQSQNTSVTPQTAVILDKPLNGLTQEVENGKIVGVKSDEDEFEKYKPRPPFPQRLIPPGTSDPKEEILKTLKQVKGNESLLDVIGHDPVYTKCLTDLCADKRKIDENDQIYIPENARAMLQSHLPIKCKDPGCPTISCVIGDFAINHVVLDLGAGVNLLPYAVYNQLGIGELRPIEIKLQFGNGECKFAMGIVEDVLVQIDKFIYPVDFVVLDTDVASTSSPIILGRPFLATSSAFIDCRSGAMELSWGQQKASLNIFDIQPIYESSDMTGEDEFVLACEPVYRIKQDRVILERILFGERATRGKSEKVGGWEIGKFFGDDVKMDHTLRDEELVSKGTKTRHLIRLGGDDDRSVGGTTPRIQQKGYVERTRSQVDLGDPPDYG